MAAGFRSPLAIWAGGAGTYDAQSGVRSPFAFWLGGACAITPTGGNAAARSLLAFWMGGAGALAGVVPVPPHIGGGYRPRPRPLGKRRRPDDELILLMAAAWQLLEEED